MAKIFINIVTLACLTFNSYSQITNIYQPNGSTTNFGKIASDSLNYYVVNYPALALMKIDENNNATLVTTLTVDPFQTMIWNNGKGIFPVANGSPFKLFDGTNQIDINGGELPMAGYTGDKVILGDYFHKGNVTYFRTNDKIYKTDYSSPSSIQTLATRVDAGFYGGINEMQHTSNSIIYWEVVSTSSAPAHLKRIDLVTGNITLIDSSSTGSYDYGTVYNDEYYYCTPYGSGSVGISKLNKISDNGTKTTLYTESITNKNFVKIIGVTPNGVIAIIATTSTGSEYVTIYGGIATPLNFNTVANSQPCGNVGVGSSRTTSSLVYFEALDTLFTVNSTNKALWVTDGTLAGTKKIISGPPATFAIDNLSPMLYGSAEHCGNDLYFAGKNGGNSTRLISVNGNNYSVQTNTFGLPNSQPTIHKTASGIYMVGSPLPTSSAEKAVFYANCSSISTDIENNKQNQMVVDVFPNPSNGNITIELYENNGNSKLTVHNLLGEVMHSQYINEQSTNINLDLNSGLYIIAIESKTEKIVKKIIIK